MAWYDNPINDYFNKLVEYVNGDVEGIVEYLASLVNVNDFKCRAVGASIVLLIIVLIVLKGGAKLFASNKPEGFGKLWERFMKGREDD